MKVLTVTGLTGSGKTTTIEFIIKELNKRGFSVGTVKEIHYESFSIDTPGKNTYRHREAGALTVTARSGRETDIMHKGHLSIIDILKHYSEDYVLLEGVRDALVPEIALCKEDEEPEITSLTFAVSGAYSNTHSGAYKHLPIINALENIVELVDLIVEKVPHLFYEFDEECCGRCGTDCRSFLAALLKGERQHEECILQKGCVSLKIDGEDVPMVPFVKNILKNTIVGFVSELKGYKKNAKIQIAIEDE